MAPFSCIVDMTITKTSTECELECELDGGVKVLLELCCGINETISGMTASVGQEVNEMIHRKI